MLVKEILILCIIKWRAIEVFVLKSHFPCPVPAVPF